MEILNKQPEVFKFTMDTVVDVCSLTNSLTSE